MAAVLNSGIVIRSDPKDAARDEMGWAYGYYLCLIGGLWCRFTVRRWMDRFSRVASCASVQPSPTQSHSVKPGRTRSRADASKLGGRDAAPRRPVPLNPTQSHPVAPSRTQSNQNARLFYWQGAAAALYGRVALPRRLVQGEAGASPNQKHPPLFMTLRIAICIAAAVLGVAGANGAQGAQPNIVFILCDDLGYGDVGVLYQNSRRSDQPRMRTPQLDRMAAGGMIMRQHYTAAPVCAPARASLLLGQHQGDCPIRNNQFDKALPRQHTLGTVLQAAGYYTGLIGKFGLQGRGPEYPGHPLRHGFNEFYGVLAHDAAHFHYPGNSGKIMDMFTPVTNGLAGAYDTDLYAARAKKFIRERAEKKPRQPFFLYLAFTAPHF